MAENWPWASSSLAASSSTSSTQQHTPTSPLQSGSLQSNHEAAAVIEPQGSRGEAASRPTLVETLRTCLTSTTVTLPAGRSLNDPGPPATLQQSRSGGAVSGSGSKTTMKRRSRASRRVPTTVVEATSSDFRETVHRLTGIATPTPAPVRPQPKRASPSTFIRPTPQVQSASPQLFGSILNITEGSPPPMHPAFWHHSHRRMGEVQQFDPIIKSEALGGVVPGIGASSQSPLGSTMPLQTWWDAGTHEQSPSSLAHPTSTGPFDGSVSSGGQILQDDFDVWFHQDPSGSDYMR